VLNFDSHMLFKHRLCLVCAACAAAGCAGVAIKEAGEGFQSSTGGAYAVGATGGAYAVGATGGAYAVDATGGAYAVDATGGAYAFVATMTPDEWQARQGPLDAGYEIFSPSCPAALPFPQGLTIMRNWSCVEAPNYSDSNPLMLCDVVPTCTGPESCQEHPFGWCAGLFAPSGQCTSAEIEPFVLERCTSDADCTKAPNGTCSAYEDYRIECFPDGECSRPGDTWCSYWPRDSCDDDSQCAAYPGGYCEKSAYVLGCRYHECLTDSDCPSGSRCTCIASANALDGNINQCVVADCWSNDDCMTTDACTLVLGCDGNPERFRCILTDRACAGSTCPAQNCPSDS